MIIARQAALSVVAQRFLLINLRFSTAHLIYSTRFSIFLVCLLLAQLTHSLFRCFFCLSIQFDSNFPASAKIKQKPTNTEKTESKYKKVVFQLPNITRSSYFPAAYIRNWIWLVLSFASFHSFSLYFFFLCHCVVLNSLASNNFISQTNKSRNYKIICRWEAVVGGWNMTGRYFLGLFCINSKSQRQHSNYSLVKIILLVVRCFSASSCLCFPSMRV